MTTEISTNTKDTLNALNTSLLFLSTQVDKVVSDELIAKIKAHVDASVAEAMLSQNMALWPLVKERDELKAILGAVIKDLEYRSEFKMGSAKGLVDIGAGVYMQAKRALKQTD